MIEDLEEKYPRLDHLLKTELFRNKDFETISVIGEDFVLLDDQALVCGKLEIDQIQGYIVGQNKDGSYTSLAGDDLYEWEITIRDFIKRNKR
jgi:hypothetical protein